MPAKPESKEQWDDYKKALCQMADLAEKAERFEDMYQYLTVLIDFVFDNKIPLQQQERNSMSVAFKNVVGALRSSWRGMQDSDLDMTPLYKNVLEKELTDKCTKIMNTLEQKLIAFVAGDNSESEVFYLKMAGDYSRYLAEINPSQEHKDNAQKFYGKASKAAEHLAHTHPTRLGLALNYSVCYYEILEDKKQAMTLAKKAFEAAIAELDTLNDSTYKDSTLIMQLLRDNLALWTGEEEREKEMAEKNGSNPDGQQTEA